MSKRKCERNAEGKFKRMYELNDEGKPILNSTHYTVDPVSGCWNWNGHLDSDGYGRVGISLQGAIKTFGTHRLMYEQENGSIPDGLVPDHLCKNRRCINPSHMEAVTNGENVLRGEGPCAKNARKTHCIHGHEFTADNTYVYRQADCTERACRTCKRTYDRQRRAKLKAAKLSQKKAA